MSGRRWMVGSLHDEWSAMLRAADEHDAASCALRDRADRAASASRVAWLVLLIAGVVAPSSAAPWLFGASTVTLFAGLAAWHVIERRANERSTASTNELRRWAAFARVVDVAAAMRGGEWRA